jgi:ribosomal protein L37AE/L43A
MEGIIPQPDTPHMWRILAVDRFPEPCGHFGPQPSPKHIITSREGPMGSYDFRRDPRSRAAESTATESTPATCPACSSASITTTAKNPSSNSYWRCTACGEIWNASRRHTVRSGLWR